jgi:hypothetical protein
VKLVVPVVNDGNNTTDRHTALEGQKKLPLGVVIKGVFERQELTNITFKRGHPVGVVPVDGPGEVDELFEGRAGARVDYLDAHSSIPESRIQNPNGKSDKREQIILSPAALLWNLKSEIWNSD